MITTQRKSAYVELSKFCLLSKPDDTLEITEWANGEGFDVCLMSSSTQMFSLTYGQLDALIHLYTGINAHE